MTRNSVNANSGNVQVLVEQLENLVEEIEDLEEDIDEIEDEFDLEEDDDDEGDDEDEEDEDGEEDDNDSEDDEEGMDELEEVIDELEDAIEEVEDDIEDLVEEIEDSDLDGSEGAEELAEEIEELIEDIEELEDAVDEIEDQFGLDEDEDEGEEDEEGEDLDDGDEGELDLDDAVEELEDAIEELAEDIEDLTEEIEQGEGILGETDPTILPKFNPRNFRKGAPIDNRYFPLKPGSLYKYTAVDNEGTEIESNQVFVTYDSRKILGVKAVVVRDTAWDGDTIVEDTFDWYAQDKKGNVWYLGELSINYEYNEDGYLIDINNDGSWEAGVNHALPGYIMEANPKVGDDYYQEFAPKDEAVDEAQVFATNQRVITDLGSFKNVLQTFESTVLEPDAREFKYYAPGIGTILVEEDLDEELANPEVISELEEVSFLAKGAVPRGTREDDVLDGNRRNNVIRGFYGNDLLRGFGGRDLLTGNRGNDLMLGGNGADVLRGGKGHDLLFGERGRDVLSGGHGKDQFVYNSVSEGGDRITDFNGRQDAIVLVEIFEAERYGSSNIFEDYIRLSRRGGIYCPQSRSRW